MSARLLSPPVPALSDLADALTRHAEAARFNLSTCTSSARRIDGLDPLPADQAFPPGLIDVKGAWDAVDAAGDALAALLRRDDYAAPVGWPRPILALVHHWRESLSRLYPTDAPDEAADDLLAFRNPPDGAALLASFKATIDKCRRGHAALLLYAGKARTRELQGVDPGLLLCLPSDPPALFGRCLNALSDPTFRAGLEADDVKALDRIAHRLGDLLAIGAAVNREGDNPEVEHTPGPPITPADQDEAAQGGEPDPTKPALDYAAIAQQLRFAGKPTGARLVEYMADKSVAELHRLAAPVHEAQVEPKTIERNVRRTTAALDELKIPLRFRVADNRVHRILPAE